MCRSIHTLYNTELPATQTEINEAALQFVRKISGYRQPSKANADAFTSAVNEISASTARLLAQLETKAPPRKMKHAVRIHNS